MSLVDRSRVNRLFRHPVHSGLDDQLHPDDLPQLTQSVTKLCRSLGAFVFVINGSKPRALQECKWNMNINF